MWSNAWPSIISTENSEHRSRIIGIDYGSGDDKTVIISGFRSENGVLNITNIEEVEKPDLVFVCEECKTEFDPCTPSFGKLVNKSKEAGWLMKWLDIGYKTWCKECKQVVDR